MVGELGSLSGHVWFETSLRRLSVEVRSAVCSSKGMAGLSVKVLESSTREGLWSLQN